MCENELNSAETKEASSIDEERAAEARRNAYYADGGDEGGRCQNASSDAGAYSPMLKDNPALKDSLRTAKIDHPLQDDPWGNALVAGIAGGIVGGGGIIKEIAKKEALALVKETTNMGPTESPTKPAVSNDEPRPSSAPVGWSHGATSAPVHEPQASTVERPFLVLAP